MKNFTLLTGALLAGSLASAQINFDGHIETDYSTDQVVMPASPLDYQIIFMGGYDEVETNATYGNAAGTVVSKSWNDFIGFTPDPSGTYLGWVSVNHERVEANDNLGDGGGMTVFAIERDADTDSLRVVDQTLSDGRSGSFFNVDFVNTTGETGMNCGGIQSSVDGRIWTAEEWWRGDNTDIADRDTSDFTIGTGTANGVSSPAGFPGFDGEVIKKHQNYNYMTEIDPKEAVALRKQYNWGRQPFEGGIIMPDNKTAYLGADATPGFFTKFVADVAGDFTVGTTYVYKHDAAGSNGPWVEIDNSDIDKMLNFTDEAVAVGATTFNRIEWVAIDKLSNQIYFTETGRDNPASRWLDEHEAGAVNAPHHLERAAMQNTHPDSSAYWDYYGRIIHFDPSTDEIEVLMEGGPYYSESPEEANYPSIHLSNPDGLNVLTVNDHSYLVINEDLNGTSHGRMPAGMDNRHCEMFLLDLEVSQPSNNDLVRISATPIGAEITGACPTPDGKTILVNSQHPSGDNPFPYNYSLTYAITGFDRAITSIMEANEASKTLDFYPNPVARTLNFTEFGDFAIYSATGERVAVYRNVNRIDVSNLATGIYFVQNEEGTTKKLIIE